MIAVQEARRDTTTLRFLLDRLGDDWSLTTSDVTEGDAGNGERLTLNYDSTRVQLRALSVKSCCPTREANPLNSSRVLLMRLGSAAAMSN